MSYDVLKHVALPLIVFVAATSVGLLLRAWVLRLLHRWSRKTQPATADIVLHAVRVPSFLWIAAIGLYLAIGTSELPREDIGYAFKILHVLLILSLTVVAANMASRLTVYSIRKAEIPLQATGLTQGVIKVVVITIGVLILLETIGISITPILTALGVGGLAVALALQDTLGNLFAGVHILVERSIRVGDFVRLETGQEGRVADIGWRTTRVQLQPNTMVIIPNSKLAQSVVTNYDLPEKRMAIQIPVRVSHGTNPDRVERVLIEETTRAAKEVPGLLSDPPPVVQFIPGCGDYSLDFTLICHVQQFEAQGPVQHELRKRIFKRFQQEGIEIPFPTRTVFMKRDEQ